MRKGPSQTAEAVAFMRAAEQVRPPEERIVDDPYARLFLGTIGRTALATWSVSGRVGRYAYSFVPGLAAWVCVRHRYIDDCLRRALAQGLDQIVLLGAGYDSRPFRFADEIAGRPVYELDFPATSRRKARILEKHRKNLPEVDRRMIEIDFERESVKERLLAAGFRQKARSFFVWEGVSMYLTRQAVKETLGTVAGLGASDSELATDFWFLPDSPDLLATAQRLTPNLLALLGEPVTFGIHPEDCQFFLERLGFRLIGIAEASALEHRYVQDGRSVYPAGYVVHTAVA